jgi:hypothetical protein
MKSSTTSDFRASLDALPADIKARARRAFILWRANPRHPSLCFKRVGGVWVVRVGRGFRALALLQNDTFYWFWIGPHDDYERMIADLLR